jgi:hypothetical protein
MAEEIVAMPALGLPVQTSHDFNSSAGFTRRS